MKASNLICSCTVAVFTVHTAVVWLLKVADSPELAVALTVNVPLP